MRLQKVLVGFYVILVLSVFAKAANGTNSQQNAATAVVHVTVIPMDRERVLEDQTVVIKGDRIAQIGASNAIKIPPHAGASMAKANTSLPA
jgi:imidazolonepropionase-like amidohydrolase